MRTSSLRAYFVFGNIKAKNAIVTFFGRPEKLNVLLQVRSQMAAVRIAFGGKMLAESLSANDQLSSTRRNVKNIGAVAQMFCCSHGAASPCFREIIRTCRAST